MRIFLGHEIIELPDSLLTSLELARSASDGVNAQHLPCRLREGETEARRTFLGWLREERPNISHVASELTGWEEEEVHGTQALIEALERLDDGRDTRVLVSSPFRMRILRAFDGEGWIVVGDRKAWASFCTAEMVRFYFEHCEEWSDPSLYAEEANLAQRRFLPPSLWQGIDEACRRFQGLQHGSTAERNLDACLDFMQNGLFEEDAFGLLLELVQE